MKKILGIIALVALCIGIRLLPHAPNIAPMTALALFSGYALGWRWAMVVAPFATFISDIFLGFYEWQVMAAVYLTYALIALIGFACDSGTSAAKAVVTSWLGSLLFFLTTNGAVWAFSSWYSKSPNGLFTAYMNGVPFLRNALIGDMIFGMLFYAGYALYRARAPVGQFLYKQFSLSTKVTN